MCFCLHFTEAAVPQSSRFYVLFFFSPTIARSLEHREFMSFFLFNSIKIVVLYGLGTLTQ